MKIIYDRVEDMTATTKRHPSRTRHRTAVTDDGKILALDIDFAIDGGAYSTLSSVVLSRGSIHAGGSTTRRTCAFARAPWRRTRRRTEPFAASARRRVCLPWSGTWTASRKLWEFPAEIRRRNFLKPGQTTITEQTIREEIDLGKLLDRALALSDYNAKKARFSQENTRA